MDRAKAVIGSVVFFVAAPGVVAGLMPWLLTDAYRRPLIDNAAGVSAGLLLVVAGLAFLIHAFAKFALDGLGTPAPVAPTRTLVVSGVYRYVRNPMYLAVLSIIAGQALIFASGAVLGYGALVAITVAAFVLRYEEPTLRESYGAQYDRYRANVPGWLPRLTPWRPD